MTQIETTTNRASNELVVVVAAAGAQAQGVDGDDDRAHVENANSAAFLARSKPDYRAERVGVVRLCARSEHCENTSTERILN